jgi:hypothetical protein
MRFIEPTEARQNLGLIRERQGEACAFRTKEPRLHVDHVRDERGCFLILMELM